MLRFLLSVAILSIWLPSGLAAEEDTEGWRKAPTGLSRGSFSRVSGPIQPPAEAEGEGADDASAGAESGGPAAAAPEAEAEEVEEPAEPRGATYGKACVIGTDGRVLYSPPGKDCGATVSRPTTPSQPVRAGGPSDSHCIYGSDGGVIHRPADADC